MKRRQLPVEAPPGGFYFPNFAPGVRFIPSGCTMLDCALGGGYAQGRMTNIVGDKSSGKTLLAIEACANFALHEPKGKIFYREAEAAFDEPYARNLGLPINRVDFGADGLGTIWDTVEDVFDDLNARLDEIEKAKVPGLYIVDSMDALSSRAEMERKPGEGTFGLEKQKTLGLLFRKLVRRMAAADMTFIIVSQVRDNIGVSFGEKHTRTGGKALDFYASQILWLSHLANLVKTVKGIKRVTGARIKANCKKNKVAAPRREAEFCIRFGYGVEDLEASVAWLEESKLLDKLGVKDAGKFLSEVDALDDAGLAEMQQKVRRVTFEAWAEVEQRFAPKRKKYAVT